MPGYVLNKVFNVTHKSPAIAWPHPSAYGYTLALKGLGGGGMGRGLLDREIGLETVATREHDSTMG